MVQENLNVFDPYMYISKIISGPKMPKKHERFSHVCASNFGVTSYSAMSTVGFHFALMQAGHVFDYLSRAGPNFDSQIKFDYQNRTRSNNCDPDLGCEFKDPRNTNQTDSSNDTDDQRELERDCDGFSIQEHCMPHIECSLSIFLLVDILILMGLKNLPDCSLVQALSRALEDLEKIITKWKDYILVTSKPSDFALGNNEHGSAIRSDSNSLDICTDSATGAIRTDSNSLAIRPYSNEFAVTGAIRPDSATGAIQPYSNSLAIRPYSNEFAVTGAIRPEQRGRPATRSFTKQYTFEKNRSPSPVLPVFRRSTHVIESAWAPYGPKWAKGLGVGPLCTKGLAVAQSVLKHHF